MRYICFYLNFQECIANYLNCLVYVDIFMNISNNHVTWLRNPQRQKEEMMLKRHRHTRAADTHGLQERAWWPREQATTGCSAVAGGAVPCADHIPTCDTCACAAAADCTPQTTTQRTLTRRPYTIISEMVTALLFQFIKCNLRNHQLYIRKYHLMFSC